VRAAATPAATATPASTAVPAATPSIGRAIPLHGAPSDVIAYRDAVWVTTPDAHAVRRVDPKTRAVETIRLEPDADPTRIEAGLGALWVDSWTDAFTRIDAATGEWTTVDMPTKSDDGYGFAIGAGAAWALDRRHGILYALDPETGEHDGGGIELGGPALDAVAIGRTVHVLMKSRELLEFDATLRSVYRRVRLPAAPVGIEREHSGFVIAFAGNRFATYDAKSLRHTGLFEMGEPWGHGEVFGDELWVTVPSADAIHRFDTRTGARLGDPIGFDTAVAAFNLEPSGRAWVALRSGALVSLDVPAA
jgi:hypothetical protein